MKLLTLNCHGWMEENSRRKIKIIASAILKNGYDVIALQEVNQSIGAGKRNGSIQPDNYAFVILQELTALGCNDYDMFWDFSHIAFDKYEEGLCVMTKHRIVKKHSFCISQSLCSCEWKRRKTVGVSIDYHGMILDFYSCHLGWWDDNEEPFRYQADQLLAYINKERLAFLLGDFNNNANIRNEGYDYLVNRGLHDTFGLSEKTVGSITVEGRIDGWEENCQGMRLDWILVNQRIRIRSSAVIFNDIHYPIVSDHYGVEVIVEL